MPPAPRNTGTTGPRMTSLSCRHPRGSRRIAGRGRAPAARRVLGSRSAARRWPCTSPRSRPITAPERDRPARTRMGRGTPRCGASPGTCTCISAGIHSCVNVVCGPEVAGGVLLRAGEVIDGVDAANTPAAPPRVRRISPAARPARRRGGPAAPPRRHRRGHHEQAAPSRGCGCRHPSAPASRPGPASGWPASPERMPSPGASGSRATPRCRRSAGGAGLGRVKATRRAC